MNRRQSSSMIKGFARRWGSRARLDLTEDLEQEAALALFLGKDPIDAMRYAWKEWQYQTRHPERLEHTPVMMPALEHEGCTTHDHVESEVIARMMAPALEASYKQDLEKYPMRHRISLKGHW